MRVFLLALLAAFPLCGEEILKLATTTSTSETGVLDVLLKPFEAKYQVKVHVISVGSGAAIKLGENGDVDLILTHARAAEEAFVSGGFGVERFDVMYNDFVLVGPKDDPAQAAQSKSVAEALQRIMSKKALFISRGDNSGTHLKELELWKKTGIVPKSGKDSFYREAGQGMSSVLRMADEQNGYTLTDRASYLFQKEKLRLVIVHEKDAALINPYGVIAVNPQKYPHVRYALALKLIQWLTSPEGQNLIEQYTVKGSRLFYKNAAKQVR